MQRFLDLVNNGLPGSDGEEEEEEEEKKEKEKEEQKRVKRGPRAVLEEVEGREKMPCLERDETLLGGKAVRFGGGLMEGKEEEWVSGLFVCRVRKLW